MKKTLLSLFIIFSYQSVKSLFQGFKLPFKTIFSSVTIIISAKIIDKHPEEEKKTLEEKSLLISLVDPEFYEFCNDIRIRMGIKEEVEFRFFDDLYKESFAFYKNGIIYINKNDLKSKESIFLDIIVHELEHYRQFHGYSGSYNGKDRKQREAGADAAAAGFIECIECLKKNKSKYSKEQLGNLTEKGYFSEADYESYLHRLEENPKICDACYFGQRNIEWKDFLSFRHHSVKKDFDLHWDSFKPLDESFVLPSIKNNKLD